ncbi:hypothetical protein PHLGIDRAFT_24533 [Phlebiopsis gigantea 11061_1 CR5-6]|uniref:AAA+ ATPase domain-containing protein n=1 Tax=Phlebiopsis gigantea (strain 11061_1 CR5-6) TaxID=745531 RepID=A0A0C3S9V3_PHLG1|nr:hypothetical protein PHLGIDRAFT_24533 [Phlebiopsis gigantea 11061_1 CR5-6]
MLLTRSLSETPSNLLPQAVDLLQIYQGQVALGKIAFDEDQVRVVMELRQLHKELLDYAPPVLTSHYLAMSTTTVAPSLDSQPWWSTNVPGSSADMKALVHVRTHAEDLANLTTPEGLLLTGPPGSGKSFLVDLWYNAVPTPYKTRKHYSQLVLEIYRAVWMETQRRMSSIPEVDDAVPGVSQPWDKTVRDRWRELITSTSLPMKWARNTNMMFSSSGPAYSPTIAFVVAQRLILKHWLLVFDEIQLLDVSSATLLADVLSWFWRMGGVIVGTSNKVPDDLYRNGVQRERLEPFVEALKVRCLVISMRTDRDWRQVRAASSTGSTWYTQGQQTEFERKLKALVFGRTVYVPWSTGGICRFTFDELCEESMGPADYLTIASYFHTVAITSIPTLKLSFKNQARRFISLIDALYETRCRILCLAEVDPTALFFPDAADATSSADMKNGLRDGGGTGLDVLLAEAVGETRDVYRPNVSSYDAPNMAEAPPEPRASIALEQLSMFSGKDEQFAYKRALSRLLEMTSESYASEEQWTPLPMADRKWEQPAGAPLPRRAHGASTPPRPDATQSADADFAEEAAYSRAAPVDPSQRPEAPRLRHEHVWGAWGRGTKVFEANQRESGEPPS